MNHTEHMLTILAEECAEVIKDATKAIRFGMEDHEPGPYESNRRRMERELAEVMAVAEELGLEIREDDKKAKRAKIVKYMEVSRKIGTLK